MNDHTSQSGLIISVSGVRGISDVSLTGNITHQYAYAYGRYFKGKIIVGRDSRKSGVKLKKSLIQGLIDSGCKVVDLDIATTPTVEMAVLACKADGGVIITASHNPAEWNGLKFLRPDGTFLRSHEIKKIFDKLFLPKNTQKIPPKVEKWSQAETQHIQAIMKIIDYQAIRKRKFTVALDTVNGAGGRIATRLLKTLYCHIQAINAAMDGNFAHWPEPTPANLKSFGAFVAKNTVQIGFALDPDADRLVLVDPKGKVINEEYTLALVINHYLRNIKTGPVVINQMTSRMNEDIAQRFKAKLIRTPVGEINVVEAMITHRAVIGGEGNGGIIDPRVHYGRDGLVGMALILEYLAKSDQTLNQLIDQMPKYVLLKEKVELANLPFELIGQKLKNIFQDSDLSESDGVRFSWPDRWLQIRRSNTEPIMRIFAEAPTEKESQNLIDQVKKLL